VTAELSHTQKKLLTDHLLSFVTEERKTRFDEVLSNRLNHMHIVLEDVYQAHNASAVVRSADCFGVQYVHFIENRNKYKISDDVALGASQWVNIQRHKDTKEALTGLKQRGFRIVATSPHKNDKTIFDFDVREKFALVFGTEKEGITSDVVKTADEFVKIPVMGFTESFNISVCAALCMQELTHKIRKEVKEAYLTNEEKESIYLDWLLKSIKRSDLFVKDFLKKNP
jgi:tRNA (guanosine-2'-O-)-methyltransferase